MTLASSRGDAVSRSRSPLVTSAVLEILLGLEIGVGLDIDGQRTRPRREKDYFTVRFAVPPKRMRRGQLHLKKMGVTRKMVLSRGIRCTPRNVDKMASRQRKAGPLCHLQRATTSDSCEASRR